MTNPQQTPDGNMLTQILVKQTEMGTQLAVIIEQLKAIPDHEARIRTLQDQMPIHLEERLSSLETSRAKLFGVAAAVSLVASAGGTWVGIFISHH